MKDIVRGLVAALIATAISACVTVADVQCRYGPNGWDCSGGVGGTPPTDSPAE